MNEPQLRLAAVGTVLTALAWIAHLRVDSVPSFDVCVSQFCFATTGDVLAAHDCDGASAVGWFAPQSHRFAAGEPICWWRASAEDLRTIGGVGEKLGERLVAFRDLGGRPNPDELRRLRGVGERLSDAVVQAVTTECGMTGTPESAPPTVDEDL